MRKKTVIWLCVVLGVCSAFGGSIQANRGQSLTLQIDTHVPMSVINSLDSGRNQIIERSIYEEQGVISYEQPDVRVERKALSEQSLLPMRSSCIGNEYQRTEQWFSYGGSPSGYITGLAISAINPNLMFAGTQGGGIFAQQMQVVPGTRR